MDIIILLLLIFIMALLILQFFKKDFSSDGLRATEEAIRQDLARQQSFQANEARALREDVSKLLDELRRAAQVQRNELAETLDRMAKNQDRKLDEVRKTLSETLEKMRLDNQSKLDQIRNTVDEKLHKTLEKRLGESFERVGKRLEDVSKGLGEMQQLATGVGDLKRVLTNVKARGTWGEYQLDAIMSETLTVEQFGRNVKTNPKTNAHVEFAIKLPGRDGEGESQLWLPIDSKFPMEDYERLQIALENADREEAEKALRQLERQVIISAKDITKYLAPPHTTDFAIMFLPTEGLYAEVLRLPGLADRVQREFRITLAGPTTLTALLNSLQMGFKTLAIEQRSSEVWRVLSAVKSEFLKFGEVFEKVQKKIGEADRELKQAQVRTRAMQRSLREVEESSVEDSSEFLELQEKELLPESSG
jgi:DNA recombination protein RmuC